MKKYFNGIVKRVLLWAFRDRVRIYGCSKIVNAIQLEHYDTVKKDIIKEVVERMAQDGLVELRSQKITSFLHSCEYKVECRVVIIK